MKNKKKFKVAIVVGTRPELIKFSPIIKELEFHKIKFFIIHTGQHYSYFLDSIFYKDLKLPKPKYNLGVGSVSALSQIAVAILKLERVFKKEKPNLVLVEGDTNSVLAGALAAVKSSISVGHVEAGLRCGNFEMHEEQNRILTDHCSSFLFAPTKISRSNLIAEGINKRKIILTGNTIVDAVYAFNAVIRNKREIFEKSGLEKQKYFLATIHRAESTDYKKRLSLIINVLNELSGLLPVIFPIHPRTKKFLKLYKLKLDKNIRLLGPVGYINFLSLLKNSFLVLTDSGGVQEEACILKIPAVTIRNETERPETTAVGANTVTGYSKERILAAVHKMSRSSREWRNPFGRGNAGKKIVGFIKEYYEV